MTTNELPKGWEKCRLPDFTRIVMGQSPPSNTYNLNKQGLPFFQGKAEFTELHPEVRKYCSAPNKIAEIGATLLTVRAPVGPTNLADQKCCVGRGLAAIHPEAGIPSRFVFFFFRSIEHEISGKGTGTTFSAINGKFLDDLPALLPPLAEQLRIVAKIEELFSELDKGTENLKLARAQLTVYRQALLKHAFEGKLTAAWRKKNAKQLESGAQILARIRAEREARYKKQLSDWEAGFKEWESGRQKESKPSKPRKPADVIPLTARELAVLPSLPAGWAWLRLGSNNVSVFDGPFGSNLKTSDYVGAGVRVVRLENIGVLRFIEEKESFISEEKYRGLTDHTVFPGDIVFSSFVTEQTRVAMVPISIEKAVNKSDCFCLRCHGTTLLSRYACVFLSTHFAFKQLSEVIHGVGRPRVNTTQVKELFIPICSPAEQAEMMDRTDEQFSALDKLESDIETNLQKAEALRQSILKKAFAGGLVPQDPADEPAAVLLARLRTARAAAVAGRDGPPGRPRRRAKRQATEPNTPNASKSSGRAGKKSSIVNRQS